MSSRSLSKRQEQALISRRSFLVGSGATAAFWALPGFNVQGATEPQQLRHIALRPGKTNAQLVPDDYPATPVWAYNDIVPGPEIRLVQGERVRIAVENALNEQTTVHWHGLRVPHAMDGVPYLTQEPIGPGEQFVYAFDVPDETVEIALVADNPGDWMFHCHILEHQAAGMMGTIRVNT